MSYDYSDLDVIINCSLFYSAAGFRIRIDSWHEKCELLVVLRGDPGNAHHSFAGRVHVYDYEKGRIVNWKQRFPKASEITLISLIRSDDNDELTYISSYVPVIPRFWQLPVSAADRRPRVLHIANYKFIDDDDFHRQLIGLIRAGLVEVHGGNWQHIGVTTRPLSYLAANRMLSQVRCCIGLMYPNQRGRTLSGRMWQAPLHGCHVITEPGTNIAACPGVVEVSRYDGPTLDSLVPGPAHQLREQAADFWASASDRLARQLGLVLSSPSRGVVLSCRSLLIGGHMKRRLDNLRQQVPGPRRIVTGLSNRFGAGEVGHQP